jgi:predicted nicotinamide N-methyase
MLAAAATPDDCYPGASFFVNLETERRWFSFGAHSLELAVSTSKCTDHDLTGQLDWPGARLLCRWLATQDESFFASEACELGSGTGLAGLFYAVRGGRVVLTDYQPVVLDLLLRNAEAFPAVASTARLLWGDAEDTCRLLKAKPGGFPLLIGADIVYPGSQACLAPLMATVQSLLSPGGVFLLCYCSRALTTDRALAAALEAEQLVARIASEAQEEGGVMGTVFRIRRRSDGG